jgi:hypothetical protein
VPHLAGRVCAGQGEWQAQNGRQLTSGAARVLAIRTGERRPWRCRVASVHNVLSVLPDISLPHHIQPIPPHSLSSSRPYSSDSRSGPLSRTSASTGRSSSTRRRRARCAAGSARAAQPRPTAPALFMHGRRRLVRGRFPRGCTHAHCLTRLLFCC